MADKWAQYITDSPANKWDQYIVSPADQQMPQNPIPAGYGFTPGHMLNQAVQGVAQLGQGVYSLGKDLVQNPNWVQGPDSTLQKFVLGPAAQMKQKAQTAPTTSESLGYSAAEAIPILGPWAAGLGEQAGTGDVGGAVARGGAQVAVPAALQSPIVRGAAKGALGGALEGVLNTKIAGGAIRGAIKGVKAARAARASVPTVEPSATTGAEVPSGFPRPTPRPAPRATAPAGAEPDIEMEARLGTTNPPEPTPIKGVGNKLGTPAEQVRVQQAMEGRGAAKQALESGPKQLTAGTAAGAASDTALFQQAKAENPGGSVSDWAKRAQELKTATLQKQLAAKPNPYASKSAPSMETVQSTNINKVGHDGSNMWVEYKSGQVYRYKDVPKDVFQQAKAADSVGSYIARNVKGKYETSLRGTTGQK